LFARKLGFRLEHDAFEAPVFNLNGWYGIATDPALDPLFFAVD